MVPCFHQRQGSCAWLQEGSRPQHAPSCLVVKLFLHKHVPELIPICSFLFPKEGLTKAVMLQLHEPT